MNWVTYYQQGYAPELFMEGGAAALAFLAARPSASTNQSVYQSPAAVPLFDTIPRDYPPAQRVDFIRDPMAPAITGMGNRFNNYGQIQKYMGEHKGFLTYAANPVTERLGSKQYLLLLFELGYGEVEIADIKIGDKSIDLFTNVETNLLPGAGPGETLLWYTDDIEQLVVGDAMPSGVWVVRTAPQQADRLSVDLSFEDGLYTVDENNNRSAASVDIEVEYRLAGSSDDWTAVAFDVVTDNWTGPTNKGVTWAVDRDNYEVRVRRVTADSIGPPTFDRCNWAALRAILNELPVRYPKDSNGDPVYRAFLEMRIEATDQVQGNLDQVSCLVRSKLPAWDGDEWTANAFTQNPAWILASILTDGATVDAVSKDTLDADAFKDWADFCDDNGFTFNYCFDSPMRVEDALKMVAAAGRAVPTFSDGLWSAIVDTVRPDIDQFFTPHNMVADSFVVAGSFKKKPHGLKIRFVNPAANWQTDTRVVYNDGYDADTAYDSKLEQIDLPGVTDPDQVYKIGRYILAAANARAETYQFQVDHEHFPVKRGSRIRVVEEVAGWGVGSSRITGLNTIVSDGLTYVNEYEIADILDLVDPPDNWFNSRVRLQDGTEFEKRIQNWTEVPTNVLPLTEKYSIELDLKPQIGDLVLVEKPASPVDLIVIGIDPGEWPNATLTCVDYAPDIFDAAEGEIPEFESNITQRHFFVQQVPLPVMVRIKSDETVMFRGSDGTYQNRVQLVMAPPEANVKAFQYQIKPSDGTTYTFPGSAAVSNGEISITDVQDNQRIDIRIRNVTFQDYVSDWLEIPGYLVVGKSTKPPGPTNLRRELDNAVWDVDSPPLDFAGSRIKEALGVNRNWDAGRLVESVTRLTTFDLNRLQGGTRTLMIKTVDTAGNESDEMESMILDLGDIVPENVFDEISYHPDWMIGVDALNLTNVAGVLEQDGDDTKHWSDPAAKYWSAISSAAFYGGIYLEGYYTISYTVASTAREPFKLHYMPVVDSESWKVEYRVKVPPKYWPRSASPLFWSSSGSAPHWADPPEFGPWLPWTGSLNGSPGYTYELKITLIGGSVQKGRILEATLIVDPPDVVEYVEAAAFTSAGGRLTLTKNFSVIKTVTPWIEQSGSYPDVAGVEVIDYTVSGSSGPFVRGYDAAHVAAAGKIGAIVKGYY